MRDIPPIPITISPLTAKELEQCRLTIARLKLEGKITQRPEITDAEIETAQNRLKKKAKGYQP